MWDVAVYGYTAGTDGWTNVNRIPIVAFTASTHVRSVLVEIENVCSPTTKDANWIYAGMCRVKEQLEGELKDAGRLADGDKALVQYLTDDASACDNARTLFQAAFPHVTVGQCALHGISLSFRDWFTKIKVLQELADKCKELIKYMNNHEKTIGAFKVAQEDARAKDREASLPHPHLPGETRAAGVYSMIVAAYKSRVQIQAAFVHPTVITWSEALPATKKSEFRTQKAVANADEFWDDCKLVFDAFENAYMCLRLADGETSAIGKIYDAASNVYAKLNDEKFDTLSAYDGSSGTDINEDIRQLWRVRWDKWHNELHSAGYLLDPEFLTHRVSGDGKEHAFDTMSEAATIIRRLISNPDNYAKAVSQLTQFRRAGSGTINAEAWEAAKKMPAYDWWFVFMSQWPELQAIALKVLSQPIGCGGVERVWSTFGWIQSKLRNRLLPENARKIVMSHMWLRLEQMREEGKWEADMLAQQDQDLLWGEVLEELGLQQEELVTVPN